MKNTLLVIAAILLTNISYGQQKWEYSELHIESLYIDLETESVGISYIDCKRQYLASEEDKGTALFKIAEQMKKSLRYEHKMTRSEGNVPRFLSDLSDEGFHLVNTHNYSVTKDIHRLMTHQFFYFRRAVKKN